MRASTEYNAQLDASKMEELSQRFLSRPLWNLGDQDWFTLLSWHMPQLFHRLPCRYNVLVCKDFDSLQYGFRTKMFDIDCKEEVAVAHLCKNKNY